MDIIRRQVYNIRMKNTSRYSRVVFYAALFLLLLILCTLFPYVSDDWTWGSTDSFAEFFESLYRDNGPLHFYNTGRYLGNFLGFVAANHHVFRCLYTAGIMTAIAALCVSLSKENAGIHTEILLGMSAAILMLTVSRNTFRQTAAWSSAFMIYCSASALLLTAYVLLRGRARGKLNLLFLFLPFAMSFFVENVTIGSLLCIIGWMIYGFIRGRKPSVNEWLYFAGALAGLIVMFSDDGYSGIMGTSDDTYWGAETSSVGAMITAALASLRNSMADLMLKENLVLTVFLSLNLGAVLIFALPEGKRKFVMAAAYAWILGTTVFLIIRKIEPNWLPDLEIVRAASAVFIIGYLFLIPVLLGCSELPGAVKEKSIMTWAFAALITLPLLVADPLSARVFNPTFTLLMLLSLQLFAWNLARVRESTPALCVRGRGVVLFLTAVILLVCWGHWFSVYAVIDHYDTERRKFVNTQEEEGIWPALLPGLPYQDYLIVTYPSTNYWMEMYQRFYDINLDLKLNVCSFEEWMEMVRK